MSAADLIAASVREDRIVHAPWTEALATDLLVESDDSADNGSEREFWGTTLAGDAWRVHLEVAS